MKKVLLIGNGAREHAIAETLVRGGAQVFTYGKARNPGLLELSEGYETGDLDDFIAMREFAKKVQPDFAVVGPDNPIADGAADLLLEAGIHSVAPLKTVARLESSKSFARDLLEKYGIEGNPRFKVFLDDTGLEEFMHDLGGNYVVKADGLMGGKGVKVSGDHLATIEEGARFARECMNEDGRVVVEEKLIGQEFSLMAFCDGTHTALMPAVQDHKRAFEGDTGPNTGGMGSYSDSNHLLPFLRAEDIEAAHAITRRVAQALIDETGTPFKGILYGGFIATADGVRLIEYNARFGDPEAMNVLPLLNTNFVHLCESLINGDMDTLPVEFAHKATVCKYLVPQGYPDNPKKGEIIEIDTQLFKHQSDYSLSQKNVGSGEAGGNMSGKKNVSQEVQNGVKLYYAAVDQTEQGLTLSSSRAVAVVGIADTLAEAERLAEEACGSVKGPVFHRKDIGTEALIRQRVSMMEALRGA